jgi:DNA-binding CsgD family transcriptional regulator
MSAENHAEAAIAGFYAASTGTGEWQTALDSLLAATGFDGAAFFVVDRARQTSLDWRWHRLDTADADAYLRDYVSIDPRAAQVFVPEPQRLLYDYLHTPESEIDRDPFYAWFQARQKHRYYVGGQSRTGGDLTLTLTLHRPRGRGHVTADELARFGRLFDHFEHAVHLQHCVGLNASRQAESLDALDREPFGVVVLDAHGHVLHANSAANAMAAQADAFTLAAIGISADNPANRNALATCIADTLRGRVSRPVRLARRFGGRPYAVTAYRMPQPGRQMPDMLMKTGYAAVAIRIFDPDAENSASLAAVVDLLGLTRQEAQVLAGLMDGADPAEIAASAGLRPATVRSYLTSIYRKVGVRRQGALVAEIAGLQKFLAG